MLGLVGFGLEDRVDDIFVSPDEVGIDWLRELEWVWWMEWWGVSLSDVATVGVVGHGTGRLKL